MFKGGDNFILDKINATCKQYIGENDNEYNVDCIEEVIIKDRYGWDDVSVRFEENGMYFLLDFDFSSACMLMNSEGFLIPWSKVTPLMKSF